MATMTKLIKATGKDTFSCRRELAADGFVFALDSWHGTQACVDRFKARGYRSKVFFADVMCDDAVVAELVARGLVM